MTVQNYESSFSKKQAKLSFLESAIQSKKMKIKRENEGACQIFCGAYRAYPFFCPPTAPIPSEASNCSTQVATTAFTQNAILTAFTGPDRQSFETRGGYQKLPGGFTLQWGLTSTGGDGMSYVTFPVEFSTKCMGIHGTHVCFGTLAFSTASISDVIREAIL
ncbi:hypothetical protein MPB2EB_1227 [Mycoavidus sp. B2-EB]|nr:hypothetical protein [Mycoavidus sp. B2-EB]BBO60089.1 hypothetical protein MPB2EB_1227 [Mycoavidus sp. B2-EB]